MFIKYFLKNQEGSVVIETAIAIVIMMSVFLSGIFFIIAHHNRIIMATANKEGSRTYQVSKDTGKAIEVTNRELILGNTGNVSVERSTGGVKLLKNISIKMPIVGDHLFKLETKTDFRKENRLLYYQ